MTLLLFLFLFPFITPQQTQLKIKIKGIKNIQCNLNHKCNNFLNIVTDHTSQQTQSLKCNNNPQYQYKYSQIIHSCEQIIKLQLYQNSIKLGTIQIDIEKLKDKQNYEFNLMLFSDDTNDGQIALPTCVELEIQIDYDEICKQLQKNKNNKKKYEVKTEYDSLIDYTQYNQELVFCNQLYFDNFIYSKTDNADKCNQILQQKHIQKEIYEEIVSKYYQIQQKLQPQIKDTQFLEEYESYKTNKLKGFHLINKIVLNVVLNAKFLKKIKEEKVEVESRYQKYLESLKSRGTQFDIVFNSSMSYKDKLKNLIGIQLGEYSDRFNHSKVLDKQGMERFRDKSVKIFIKNQSNSSIPMKSTNQSIKSTNQSINQVNKIIKVQESQADNRTNDSKSSIEHHQPMNQSNQSVEHQQPTKQQNVQSDQMELQERFMNQNQKNVSLEDVQELVEQTNLNEFKFSQKMTFTQETSYYTNEKTKLQFKGRICPPNFICILDESFEVQEHDTFINKVSRRKSERFAKYERENTGKHIFNIFRDDEFMEIMYSNVTLVYEELYGDGLYLVIFDRQNRYPLRFLSSYDGAEDYDNLAQDIENKWQETSLIVVFSIGKWFNNISPYLQSAISNIGGVDLFPIIERMKIDKKITQITIVGRKYLCLGNGITKNFQHDLVFSHNVFYDPRFSPEVPIIQDILLKGSDVYIKGVRLGKRVEEIESVIIKSQICKTVYIEKPDEQLICRFERLESLNNLDNLNIIQMKSGLISSSKICPFYRFNAQLNMYKSNLLDGDLSHGHVTPAPVGGSTDGKSSEQLCQNCENLGGKPDKSSKKQKNKSKQKTNDNSNNPIQILYNKRLGLMGIVIYEISPKKYTKMSMSDNICFKLKIGPLLNIQDIQRFSTKIRIGNSGCRNIQYQTDQICCDFQNNYMSKSFGICMDFCIKEIIFNKQKVSVCSDEQVQNQISFKTSNYKRSIGNRFNDLKQQIELMKRR